MFAVAFPVIRLLSLCIVSLACLAGRASGMEVAPKPADEDEVLRLIDGLVEVESFDTGLSATYGGSGFPPVAGQEQFHVGLLGQSVEHARHEGLTRLVELGPHALAALLKHLDDKRPTKLKVEHGGAFGAMWYAHEVPVRAGNETEIQALKNAGFPDEEDDGLDANISEHTVTVGDVCFVIIGMITNRGYNAARYQPTACQVVNSPTQSPAIAKAVRAVWEGGSDAEALVQHLKGDFDGGHFDVPEPDEETTRASFHSSSAATRLLYYFPDRAADMVATRIAGSIQREKNGHHNDLSRLLQSVAWAPQPGIRELIKKFVLSTADPDLIDSGVAAFRDPEVPENHAHLLALADKLKHSEEDPYGYAVTEVLLADMNTFSDKSAETVVAFLKGAKPEQLSILCKVCYMVPKPPVPELLPLLEKKSEGYGRYLIPGEGVLEDPGQEDFLGYRVCDNIYEIVSRVLGDEKAKCTGDRKVMDRKIAALRQRLKMDTAAWPFSEEEIRARQLEQDQVRLAREARLERIDRAAEDRPEIKWYLTAVDPASNSEEIEKVLAALITPQQWEPHAKLSSVMANRRDEMPARREFLTKEQQAELGSALIERTNRLLADAAPGSLPEDAIAAAFFLARWDARAGGATLGKVVNRIGKLRPMVAEDDGFRMRPPDLDVLLGLLDEMIHRGVPGAGAAYRGICESADQETLTDTGNSRAFLKILGSHWEDPEVSKVLTAMFMDEDSDYHLSKTTYSICNDYGGAGLLKAPIFRRAMRAAIEDETKVGELRIKEDDPGYCWISWYESSSGQGIPEKGPVGAKPGGPAMAVRHCDAIIAGVANAVFNEVERPEFRIYWPLEKREEARKEWMRYLEE